MTDPALSHWMTVSEFDPNDSRLLPRFRSKLVVNEQGCWVWTAGKYSAGYGTFKVARKSVLSHRVAYETLVGPIAAGLHIDHLCRNRGCCNPAHLETVTQAENTRRGLCIGNTWSQGERCGMAKLSAEEVKAIRRLSAKGGVSRDALVDRFGVSKSAIAHILQRRTWSHLQD